MQSVKNLSVFLSALVLVACSSQPANPSASNPSTAPSSAASPAPAAKNIQTQTLEYKQGEQVLEGYLAYDANLQGKRPGVLVIHEWTGLNDYVRGRARQLAELGYVAFAADIYGKGIRPQPPASGQEASKYYTDRNLAKARANAGFEVLRSQSRVDPSKTAAIGYCFGGSMALELARSGAEADGFVVFHGGLRPTESEGKNIKGKVLVLNGADDTAVPATDIAKFKTEMDSGGVDWQLINYSNTVHAFTNPESGARTGPTDNAAYNAESDRRSWKAMQDFFAEIFQ
ncbi:MAG: dienelactone hydrolase family protein [Candidatus Sericytochromatia bacterium]|nr:dienelactone hydrolase family protein [Candidatus Sericytochromatia bacterium]